MVILSRHEFVRASVSILFAFFLVAGKIPEASCAEVILRVGVYQNKPLVFWDEKQGPRGIYVDVLEHMAREEGWRPRYIRCSWGECLSLLREGGLDILSGVAYTAKRASLYDFTKETVLVNWAQVYVGSDSEIRSLPDLSGKRVAVLQGDIYYSGLREILEQFHIQSHFLECGDYETVLAAVQEKKADAGVVNRLIGRQLETMYSVEKTPIIFNPVELRFALPKDRQALPDLADRIDGRFRELKSDKKSVYYRSIDKWFGSEEKEGIPDWLLWAFALSGAMVFLFIAHNVALQSRVRSRTRELQYQEKRYRNIFETTGVSLWEEDLSGVSKLFDDLRRSGVTDFRKYAENHPEFVGQTAEAVQIKDVNQATLRMYRAKSKEEFFNGLGRIFTLESYGVFREGLIAIFEGSRHFEAETVNLTLDGSPIDILLSIVVPDDPPGSNTVIVGMTDITSRKNAVKALQQSEARLKEAEVIARLGHWEWNLVDDSLYWSDETCRIFGVDQEAGSATYETFLDRVHPDDRIFVRNAFKEAARDRTCLDIVHRLLLRDGAVKYVSERCTVFYDEKGMPVRLLGTVLDITEQKIVELELQHHRDNLELLVQDRTAALVERTRELERSQKALQFLLEDVNEAKKEVDEANNKLKELDRLKSLFIASMSHELRTPLNAVIGFSGILHEEWQGPLNREQKESLNAILQSGRHLLAIINDIIDITKIEAGRVQAEVESFPLQEAVEEAVATVRMKAEAKRIALHVDQCDVMMHTDRRRLVQCLMNLLANAEKFTDAGTVSVAISKVPGENDDEEKVVMSVGDTGIGISEENMDRLFEPFSRLDQPAGVRYPGTGLGLYLTRELTEQVLRGTVDVRSTLAKGSIFTLTVPVRIRE